MTFSLLPFAFFLLSILKVSERKSATTRRPSLHIPQTGLLWSFFSGLLACIHCRRLKFFPGTRDIHKSHASPSQKRWLSLAPAHFSGWKHGRADAIVWRSCHLQRKLILLFCKVYLFLGAGISTKTRLVSMLQVYITITIYEVDYYPSLFAWLSEYHFFSRVGRADKCLYSKVQVNKPPLFISEIHVGAMCHGVSQFWGWWKKLIRISRNVSHKLWPPIQKPKKNRNIRPLPRMKNFRLLQNSNIIPPEKDERSRSWIKWLWIWDWGGQSQSPAFEKLKSHCLDWDLINYSTLLSIDGLSQCSAYLNSFDSKGRTGVISGITGIIVKSMRATFRSKVKVEGKP